MSRKAKTPKFKIFHQLPNCFDFYLNEDWRKFWDGPQAVTVELGCGRAELLLELARRHPKRRFVGMDVKSDRMYRPASIARAENLNNMVFVRANATRLNEVFKPGEINELWLAFPDPYPKKRSAKHRLLHPEFLDRYALALKPGSQLNLKTDSQVLFEWSLLQLKEHRGFELKTISRDLHQDDTVGEEAKILTTYERKFLSRGLPVFYARAGKKS